jgi:hypothetical protein
VAFHVSIEGEGMLNDEGFGFGLYGNGTGYGLLAHEGLLSRGMENSKTPILPK